MAERFSIGLTSLLLAAIVLAQTAPLAPGSCCCRSEVPAPGGSCCRTAEAVPRATSSRMACCQQRGGRVGLADQPHDGDATGCGKYRCACRRVELLVLKPTGDSIESARGRPEATALPTAVVVLKSTLSVGSVAARGASIRPSSGDRQALHCVWQI
ncbi:MAG: hypothetical protein J5I93_10475 [Pirellulaceae bacterium]|nr:hypothetical protein [Pirellulaceae bacterium]